MKLFKLFEVISLNNMLYIEYLWFIQSETDKGDYYS